MNLSEFKFFLLVASAFVVTVVEVVGILVVNGVEIYFLIQKDKRQKKKEQKQSKKLRRK
ncbi:hypothetical protein NQ129_26385 [Priestia aryabhattai]|uniref:hypothetical protein n=1 Tax=Priestia aryabhattai TaxID=412384 RepID=UPI00211CB6E1|nr:hypothetical protein [Priestia aryabhattai]MCQ9285297.1 hypothetical protein [Priestia aryabhattai]